MPLKVIRRPYQDCAYRWALSTSGISTGEGDCSESQCDELNGSFTLDFSACDSKAGKLVWAGDCESQGARCGAGSSVQPGYRCNELRYAMNVPEYGTEPYASEYTGDFIMSGIGCGVRYDNHCVDVNYDQWQYAGCDLKSNRKTAIGNYYGVCTASYVLAGRSVPIWSIGYSPIYYHLAIASCSSIRLVGDGAVFLYSVNTGYFSDPTGLFTGFGYYLGDGYRLGDATLVFTKWITVGEDSPCLASLPSTITLTRLDDAEEGSTGPDKNDRIRSKWHLSYDIDAQLWTLRSFNRIDYPVYTLSDASPCDGDTKTLLLSDRGSAADGCGVAPAEVTITRVCPPDRVGKSALLEDRKPNGATGKRKRQCGCDCLDEVDDRRHTCATKCASAATEGCERIDPAPDDITCRYPEAINCCANTAGKDVPCAYVVEFECDLFFDIEDVRHKIAAKQVVLRRECYFEDPCLFVAPGPESSTGGSPVMDTDGFPGAQPVCATCEDLCLTGCTWSAWTVAECPQNPCVCFETCLQPNSTLWYSTLALPSLTMTPNNFAGQAQLVLSQDTYDNCRSPMTGISVIEDGTGICRGSLSWGVPCGTNTLNVGIAIFACEGCVVPAITPTCTETASGNYTGDISSFCAGTGGTTVTLTSVNNIILPSTLTLTLRT